jgi:hypothetical protein
MVPIGTAWMAMPMRLGSGRGNIAAMGMPMALAVRVLRRLPGDLEAGGEHPGFGAARPPFCRSSDGDFLCSGAQKSPPAGVLMDASDSPVRIPRRILRSWYAN